MVIFTQNFSKILKSVDFSIEIAGHFEGKQIHTRISPTSKILNKYPEIFQKSILRDKSQL